MTAAELIGRLARMVTAAERAERDDADDYPFEEEAELVDTLDWIISMARDIDAGQ